MSFFISPYQLGTDDGYNHFNQAKKKEKTIKASKVIIFRDYKIDSNCKG